jgi:hypothetical protein
MVLRNVRLSVGRRGISEIFQRIWSVTGSLENLPSSVVKFVSATSRSDEIIGDVESDAVTYRRIGL